MFEKFGEMNSYQEINELAENQFNEGDMESLKAMAEENGIPADLKELTLQLFSASSVEMLTKLWKYSVK